MNIAIVIFSHKNFRLRAESRLWAGTLATYLAKYCKDIFVYERDISENCGDFLSYLGNKYQYIFVYKASARREEKDDLFNFATYIQRGKKGDHFHLAVSAHHEKAMGPFASVEKNKPIITLFGPGIPTFSEGSRIAEKPCKTWETGKVGEIEKIGKDDKTLKNLKALKSLRSSLLRFISATFFSSAKLDKLAVFKKHARIFKYIPSLKTCEKGILKDSGAFNWCDHIISGPPERASLAIIGDKTGKLPRYIKGEILNQEELPFIDHCLFPQGALKLDKKIQKYTGLYGFGAITYFCRDNYPFDPCQNMQIVYRPIQQLVDELRNLLVVHGINQIYFAENCINHSPRRLKELCESIRKEFPDRLRWFCHIDQAKMDDQLVDLMKKAGCVGFKPMRKANCFGFKPMKKANCFGFKPMKKDANFFMARKK